MVGGPLLPLWSGFCGRCLRGGERQGPPARSPRPRPRGRRGPRPGRRGHRGDTRGGGPRRGHRRSRGRGPPPAPGLDGGGRGVVGGGDGPGRGRGRARIRAWVDRWGRRVCPDRPGGRPRPHPGLVRVGVVVRVVGVVRVVVRPSDAHRPRRGVAPVGVPEVRELLSVPHGGGGPPEQGGRGVRGFRWGEEGDWRGGGRPSPRRVRRWAGAGRWGRRPGRRPPRRGCSGLVAGGRHGGPEAVGVRGPGEFWEAGTNPVRIPGRRIATRVGRVLAEPARFGETPGLGTAAGGRRPGAGGPPGTRRRRRGGCRPPVLVADRHDDLVVERGIRRE